MAATPKTLEFFELKPGTNDVELVSVKDHVGKTSGNPGWKWTFKEIRSGETFDMYTMFSQKARWKLIEVLNAFGWESEDGLNDIDPNIYIGQIVTGEFDYQEEDEFSTSMGGPKYLELRRVYRQVSEDDLPQVDQSKLLDAYNQVRETAGTYDEERDGAKF